MSNSESDGGSISDFSLRIRINLAPGCALAASESELSISPTGHDRHVLLRGEEGQPLSKARRLVLTARGWPTEDAAQAEGSRYADALALACVGSRLGCEARPRRRGGSHFTPYGLEFASRQAGRRVLDDTHGLMSFESDPEPRFASMQATFVLGVSSAKFSANLTRLIELSPQLSEPERLAVDLFGASFFEGAPDTRLIILVMAVEALLRPLARSSRARQIVATWEQSLRASDLTDVERNSMMGALRHLRNESIGSAGRRLTKERLAGRQYGDVPATRFFDHCYELRSRLVHSDQDRPTAEQVGPAAANLELLVSDLITAPFGAEPLPPTTA